MTIGKKFGLACATLVLLAIVSGVFSIYSVGGIRTNLQAIVVDSLPGVYYIGVLESIAFEQRGNQWKYLAGNTLGMAEIERANQQLQQKFWETSGWYEKTITLAEDRQLFGNIKPAYDRYLAAWESAAALKRDGKADEAVARYGAEVEPLFRVLEGAAHTLVDWNKKNGDRNAEAASATVGAAQFWSWLLLAISVTVGSLLAFFTTRSVNLTLTRAIAELSEGAEQVASAASQVSSSSQSLAQGSSEQAASLEETSASSEQINAMARKNSENSRAAAGVVTGSQQKFVLTNQSLEQTVVAMGEIHTQSGKISKIIKVIDEIAFQTNILALNAAVEAARAGEAGMGFAVVADEVRNLAQRSAQAAKDTAELIEESISKSNDGKAKVDQVAVAIRQITEEFGKVKTLVDEVNQGSEEQTRGIDEVAKAVLQMQTVTQATAAGAEESAAAAEELSAQSEAMKDVVRRLTTMVGGGGGTSHVRAHQASRRSAGTSVPSRAVHRTSQDDFPMD